MIWGILGETAEYFESCFDVLGYELLEVTITVPVEC